MDSIVDFLIKKQEFSKANIEECFIDWGGERFSHDPPKYIYNSSLVFHENTNMSYYENLIGNKIDIYKYTSLTLEGDKLKEIDKLVNNGSKITNTNDLIIFIDSLYMCLNSFCIVKLRNEEYVDEVYVIKEAAKALEVLFNSLKRNFPKGIIIIKK